MVKKAYEKQAIKLAKKHANNLASRILSENTDRSTHFMEIYEDELEKQIIKKLDENG